MSRFDASFPKLLIGAGALLFMTIAQAQVISIRPSQRLPMPPNTAPQPTEPARFGEFVATDGRTILVTVSQGPAAYTYVKNASNKWVFEAALAPAEGTTSLSGAVRGNVAVVSGTVGRENTVFVFLRSDGPWVQTQTITGFGFSNQFNMVALGPDYLAIGDFGFNDSIGAVHVYSQTGAGTYVLDSTLTPGDPNVSPGWLLGHAPIADGDTLTSFAAGGETVHVFVRAGGVWTEQAGLTQLGMAHYGFSGNRAFISFQNIAQPAPLEFVRRDGAWTAGAELIHPQAPDKGFAGGVIAMDGRRVVVTEHSQVGPREDAIAFKRGDAGWLATRRLRRANLPECSGEGVGVSLAIAGKLVAASCPHAPTPHPVFEGRVRIYDLSE